MKKILIMMVAVCVASIVHAQSSFYFSSSQASWIGYGETVTGTDLTVSYASYAFPVLSANFSRFNVQFIAPNRGSLEPMMYSNAERAFFNGAMPGLNLSTSGRGNNTLGGWFNIIELVQNNGQITSAAIDFMQYDEHIASWWNFGSLRYNSSLPITTVPEPQSLTLILAGLSMIFLIRKRL